MGAPKKRHVKHKVTKFEKNTKRLKKKKMSEEETE